MRQRSKEMGGRASAVLVESQTVMMMMMIMMVLLLLVLVVLVLVLVVLVVVPPKMLRSHNHALSPSLRLDHLLLPLQITLIDLRPLSKFECWARGCVSHVCSSDSELS